MAQSFVQPFSKDNARPKAHAPMGPIAVEWYSEVSGFVGHRVTVLLLAGKPLNRDGALRRKGHPPQGQKTVPH